MSADVYPDDRVERFVTERFVPFVPVEVHVRDQANDYKLPGEPYGVLATPTTPIQDPYGKERHCIEGFLPADDCLALLAIGATRLDFSGGRFEDAERDFGAITDRYTDTDAAAEAQYWAGVSRYKATNDATAFADTACALRERHQDSTWAKKASVRET